MVEEVLSADYLNWIGTKFLDPIGRVFERGGDYYRAIYPHAVPYVEKLFRAGVIDKLVSKRLVPEQERTNLKIDGYAMVLKSKGATFRVLADVYTGTMLRDAALNWIAINEILQEYDLGLIDGHLHNFYLFDNCQARWVDIGSIQPLQEAKQGCAQFCEYFFHPLILMAHRKGLGRVSRVLIKAGGISAKELLAMTDAEFRTAGSRREILADFRRTIETMHPTADSGYWTDYGTGRLDKIGGPSGSEPSPNDEDPRTYRILDLAAKASPRTVLDVGANDGVFSAHLARAGYEVLAVDTDEGAIDQFYRWVREKSEPLSAYACVNDFVSLPYQADLVVAAALTHHLALTDKFKFDYIAKRLAEMSRQSLITEFMGNGLGKHEPIPDPLPDYYTLGAFLAALREHFAEVESLEYERPAECSPRTLIFCTGRL